MKNITSIILWSLAWLTANAQSIHTPEILLKVAGQPAGFLEPARLSVQIKNNSETEICFTGNETLASIEVRAQNTREWTEVPALGLIFYDFFQTRKLPAGQSIVLDMDAFLSPLLRREELKSSHSRQYLLRVRLMHCDQKASSYSEEVPIVVPAYAPSQRPILDFLVKENLAYDLAAWDAMLNADQFTAIQELIRRYPSSIFAQYARLKLVYQYQLTHFRDPKLTEQDVETYHKALRSSHSPFIKVKLSQMEEAMTKSNR